MEQQLGGSGNSSAKVDSKRYIDHGEAETIEALAAAADHLGLLEGEKPREAIDMICERIKDLARP